MNAEQNDVMRELEHAQKTQTEPEEMKESLLMRFLYWEKAIDKKLDTPYLETKDGLIQKYIEERRERREETEEETSD